MIRFGIIGTNTITDNFLKGALMLEDFSINAVYSRTYETAKEFGLKYGVNNFFTDLDEMAKSGLIDAVYIASPNSFHSPQAISLLNRGIHVLCEKPAASNSVELKAMIEAAKKNNTAFMEALKSSFLPSYSSIKENLNKIGKVRRFVSNYCQYSSRYDAYKAGNILNAFNPNFSNGSIMDIGIYCVYPVINILGSPKEIKANGFLLNSGIDGEGSIILKYDDMEAVIMHSKISNSYLASEIQGEEGSIIIDKISTPDKVFIHYKDGRIEDISKPTMENNMYYEAKEFIEIVKAKKLQSDINSWELSGNVMKVLDEARRQIGLVFPADMN